MSERAAAARTWDVLAGEGQTDAPAAPQDCPGKILVVDDDRTVQRAVAAILRSEGFEVRTAGGADDALAVLDGWDADVVFCDIQMPGVDGLELLELLRRARPHQEVVVMTAYGTVERAVRALKLGAYDFLTKPFEDVMAVARIASRAVEKCRLAAENRRLRSLATVRDGFEGIIGTSPAMQEVYRLIESIGPSDATVLVQGESGTGKELVARAIHARSRRSNRPFLAINCSALPDTLLESELFGHVRGAFTGATANKQGLFQVANGGTLFLDEVGDLSPMTQVKLLRALQEGEVRPVGSNEVRKVDVRIIAATNVDLEEAMAKGRFRDDLYWRLNVIRVELPPLRERVEDIPLLAYHFLRLFSGRMRKRVEGFDDEVLRIFQGYRWEGNVRELENVVERAVILARGPRIGVEVLPPHMVRGDYAPNEAGTHLVELEFRRAKELAVARFERHYLQALLARHDGNISAAARHAGMDRSNFRRLLKRHGLRGRDTAVS